MSRKWTMLIRVEPGEGRTVLIHLRKPGSDVGTTLTVENGAFSRTLAKGQTGIEVDCEVEDGRTVRYPHGKK
jgi:hypothetical protein